MTHDKSRLVFSGKSLNFAVLSIRSCSSVVVLGFGPWLRGSARTGWS